MLRYTTATFAVHRLCIVHNTRKQAKIVLCHNYKSDSMRPTRIICNPSSRMKEWWQGVMGS